ncbi:pantetheine-phosphate adenylyltransferase [bacterium DOLZORAL124_64_63]|nr:MAG: pantetheine-phosphate adenylyltransferase [bacterium DOLZORAL124_64_63]
MEKHVLYPGSFDPVTLGHLDILERGAAIFDRITVVVAEYGKADLLDVDTRVRLFRESVTHLPNVRVEPFSGLLVDEVRQRGAMAVLRGIRNNTDYEHESALAGVNALLDAEVEYLYLLARPGMVSVSSTLVRDVIKHQGPLERLVPAPVIRFLSKAQG